MFPIARIDGTQMSFWSRLFLRPSYALNPVRTTAARRDFDIDRGFDAYATMCQNCSSRQVARADSDLARRGVELLTLFSEDRASSILSDLLASSAGTQRSDKGIDYSEALAFEEGDLLFPIFHEIFQGDTDRKIFHHFGSEYLIYSFAVTRTLPVTAARRSFLWHCDRGPRRFLKILLYLNGSATHGGNTEFLDRDTTAAFETLGYIFGPNKRRSADLEPLARKYDIPYAPLLTPVKAGQALLFEPASTLHRGVLPSRGERYLLSLMLIPSPIPWHSAFAAASHSRFCETNAGVWPSQANDLLTAMNIR